MSPAGLFIMIVVTFAWVFWVAHDHKGPTPPASPVSP